MTQASQFRQKTVLLGAALLMSAGLSIFPGARSQAEDRKDPRTSPPRPERTAAESLVPTANLLEMMRQGGVLMWPLAFCSFLGLAFALERFVSLRRSRVIPKSLVSRVLTQVRDGNLDRERGLEVCQDNASPIAQIFTAALRKWGRPEVEVEQAILDSGERATNGLRRYLRVFTALTVLAPLLGLLGTAFGMIHAFNAVASSDALGRPELLAKGISQALLNTAFGLTVAIPAQSFYFFFVSRVDQLIIEMDSLGQQLVQAISAEGLEARPLASRVPKPRRPARREAEAKQTSGSVQE